jgi:hypothetical protein
MRGTIVAPKKTNIFVNLAQKQVFKYVGRFYFEGRREKDRYYKQA